MDSVFVGNRGLQATTEGNKATRTTALMIQVDPDNVRDNPRSANEPKSRSELARDPQGVAQLNRTISAPTPRICER